MVSFQSITVLLLGAVLALDFNDLAAGFSLTPVCTQKAMISTLANARSKIVLREAEEPQDGEDSKKDATKISLEEKMAGWEASEEEIKAATLGGVVPERTDSFDVGLYVAFPFMIIGCLLFLAFPFIAGNIDVSSVGPPPTS